MLPAETILFPDNHGRGMADEQYFNYSGDSAYYYHKRLGPFLFEPYADIMANRIRISKTASVLELACGTGILTKVLARQMPPDAQFIATDINADMLSFARQSLQNDNIKFQIADLQALPFTNDSFDVIVCQFGVMFAADRQKAFNEVYRVLKPGGRFYFCTWDSHKVIPIFKLFFADIILPFLGEDNNPRFVLPFSMHSTALLLNLMGRAGFRQYSVERIAQTGTTPSAEDFVTDFLLKHPVGKEVQNRAPEALTPLANRLKKTIIEKFGEGPLVCELHALFAMARK